MCLASLAMSIRVASLNGSFLSLLCHLLQVRVVIQNAKGQVHEDEVMGVLATRESHNLSTNRPVAMDMTLVEGVASDSMGCVVPEQVSL